MSSTPAATPIDTMLADRGSRYGEFADHAFLSQGLVDSMRLHHNWGGMPPVHREALEMIQHKIARVVNGDPNYLDSWDDIIGYAELARRFIKGEPT